MHIKILSTEEEFFDLQSAWDELLNRSFWCNVFSTPDWNYAWWMTYSQDKSLLIWTCWKEDQLIGIFPLFKTKSYGIRTIQPIGLPLHADMCNLIADRENHVSVHALFFSWLSNFKNWDILRIANIPFHSMPEYDSQIPVGEQLTNLSWKAYLNNMSFKYYCTISLPCMVVSVENLTQVEGLLRKKCRHTYRKTERKMQAEYNSVESRCLTPTIPLLEELIDLTTSRTQAYLYGKSFFNSPGADSFVKNLIQFSPTTYGHIVYALYLKDEMIAYEFAFHWKDSLLVYFRSFDNRFRQFSPGFFLLCKFIDEGIKSKKINSVNLLLGDEIYKTERFAAKRHEQFNCTIYNQTILGRSLEFFDKLVRIIKKKIKKI